MKRTLLSFFLVVCLLFSVLPTTFAFSDIEMHWAKDYIGRVVDSGLFNGVTADRFAPDSTMTRGMFVTVLGRFEGIDTDFWSREGAPQFFKQDVDNDAYYAPHIRWGVCNGIVNGVNDFLFAPDRPITREQMAKLVSYYLDAMGHSLSTDPITFDLDDTDEGSESDTDGDSNVEPDTNPDAEPDMPPDTDSGADPETESDSETDPDGSIFSDFDSISSWALDSVLRLYHAGILTGYAEDDGSTTFRPQATATRAQCAAVFCRISDALIRSETPPVAAEEIVLNKEEVTLSEGYSFRLVATTKPDNIPILWRSSDSNIVTVDQEGLVTFVSPGYTQVYVYTRDGLYDFCNFICEEPTDEDDENTGNEDSGNDDTGNDDTGNDDTGNDNTGDNNSGNDDTQNDPKPNLPNANFTKEEKCIFMFGESVKDPRLYYATAAEAEADMVKVDIQAWYLKSNGEKVPKTWTLTVHKNLAETVKAIFEDIFNGPEQFPIHQIYCYSWSGKSEHTIGSAIDINWDENYYCDPSGNALVGNFWKPGENPYSITPGGDVATAFNKYGYIWGINWNSGYKDYMHFSFFGT